MSARRQTGDVFEDRRQAGCLAVAVALVIAGTLGTGLLPSTTAAQVAAGGAIVLGFALAFYCLGALEFPPEPE
jgi:hypothetical protein